MNINFKKHSVLVLSSLIIILTMAPQIPGALELEKLSETLTSTTEESSFHGIKPRLLSSSSSFDKLEFWQTKRRKKHS